MHTAAGTGQTGCSPACLRHRPARTSMDPTPPLLPHTAVRRCGRWPSPWWWATACCASWRCWPRWAWGERGGGEARVVSASATLHTRHAPTHPPLGPAPQVGVLLSMPADSPARFRRRGHVLTAVEHVCAAYRLLPPTPLWYSFLGAAPVAGLLRTGLSGGAVKRRAAAACGAGWPALLLRCCRARLPLLPAHLITRSPCPPILRPPRRRVLAGQGAADGGARGAGGAGGAAGGAARLLRQRSQRGGGAGGGQPVPHLPGARRALRRQGVHRQVVPLQPGLLQRRRRS